MTKEEAREQALHSLWCKLPSRVTEVIEDACNSGEFEITVEKHVLSEKDIESLNLLGYCVTYDGSDKFCPIYYINWK